jgi:hypothetical protein
VSQKEIKQMPEFHQEGRLQAPKYANLWKRLLPTSKNIFFLSSGIFFLIVFRLKAFRLPREAWYFLICGVILFGLSIILYPLLYEPDRYLNPGLNLFIVFFLGVNAKKCYQLLLRVPLNIQRRLVTMFGSIALGGAVLFFTYREIQRRDYLGWFVQLSEEGLDSLHIYYIIYCVVLAIVALAVILGILLILRQTKTRLPQGILAVAALVVFLTAGASYNYNIEATKKYFVTYPYPRLYKFLATLPQDSFLAGPPQLMDPVPLFSRRRVLVTNELSLPYFRGYYELIKKRTLDFLNAYYAPGQEELLSFAATYKVDYLVMNALHFNPGYLSRGGLYWEPYDSYIRKLVSGRNNFFLKEPPPEMVVFQYKTIYVLDMKQLLRH